MSKMKQTKQKPQKNKSLLTLIRIIILLIIGILFRFTLTEDSNYTNIIKYNLPINYEIVNYKVLFSKGYRFEILYKGQTYTVSIIRQDYYNYVNNKIKPKLFYNNNKKEVFSLIRPGVITSKKIFLIIIAIIIAIPYKLTVILIMKIKPVHNYIKETEPIMYGYYLDNIIKKKKGV